MAKLPGAFNSDEHDDMNNYEPLPVGDYNVKIISSDEKRNKKSDAADSDEFGMRLNFEMEVLDGEHKGKKLFEGLNHLHPNKQTQEISQKTLATMIRACGKINPEETEELHGIPMVASVIITPGDGDYDPGNKIKMYKEYYGPIEATVNKKEKPKTEKSW